MSVVKKVLALILIASFAFSFNVYSYNENDMAMDVLSENLGSYEVGASEDESFSYTDNQSNQNGLVNIEIDVNDVDVSFNETETTLSTTSFSNGIIEVDRTNIVMPENSSTTIGYQILDPSYTVDFWYEGSRSFTMNVTD